MDVVSADRDDKCRVSMAYQVLDDGVARNGPGEIVEQDGLA